MAEKFEIKNIKARQILDSNGKPTVEVELRTNFGKFRASVPSGVSTGKYEAKVLETKKAIENIEKIISPAIKKEGLTDQKRIDELLIHLDGAENKSRLGANAILPVSIAVCRAIAAAKNLPLYQYISQLTELTETADVKHPQVMPKPSFNMIEGGKHAPSTSSGRAGLVFQEFMVIPQKETFRENLEIGKEVYNSLRKVLEEKFGKENIKLSAEGAFSSPIEKITDAFDLILGAAEKTGHRDGIKLATDAAASSFYGNGNYKVDGETFPKDQLIDFYLNLIEKYPIISFEDPFAEDDYDAWSSFKYKIQDAKYNIHVFGDDLTATNLERIKASQEKNACSGLIIKPNQIGTVSETIEAVKLAKTYDWKIMVANRAGETEDDFIADLAVGIGAEFIKSGAPQPRERMIKYNRLLKIEQDLCQS
jgi:enolase